MLFEIDGCIVFSDGLAHIRGKEKLFKGISNSIFIPNMFFILSSQIKNIRKDAYQTDKVDNRNQ